MVFLQENHSVKKDEKRWRMESGDRIYFSHGTNNARGVAILFHKSLNIKFLYRVADKNGRYLILKCKVGTANMLLVNIYAPNQDEPDFFADLFKQIDLRTSK